MDYIIHGSKCNKKVKWENFESEIFGRCPIVLSWRLDEKWSGSESSSVMSDSLQPHGLYSPCMTNPAQNTGVGSLSLLQGIFPTQGSNPGLPALQVDSLPAEPQGKPKNTGVGSLSLLQRIFLAQKSNWCLSCIAGRFFTNWAIRESNIGYWWHVKYLLQHGLNQYDFPFLFFSCS